MKHLIIVSFVLLLFSCKKDETNNPFDNPVYQKPTEITNPWNASPTSIAGIHARIFKPTCANSGCHDGTFEPDFRTIESSYNTLVNQPIIKNNPQGTFSKRVVPGNPDMSVLIHRMITDIDGQSGIMPLSIDPGSDWEAQKTAYINNIRAWIADGAKDVYGNSPGQSSLPPQLKGIRITALGGSQAYARNIQTGSIVIPSGVNEIDVWFSCEDDITPLEQLTIQNALISTGINDFSNASQFPIIPVSPVTGIGFGGNEVSFQFKTTVNISGFNAGTSYFVRVIVQDELPSPTELPGNGSAEHVKRFYSFEK